jgi:LAS superfamily LD-carboxypeptidase LdcB
MKNYIIDEEDDFVEDEFEIDEKIEYYKQKQFEKKIRRKYKFKITLIFLLILVISGSFFLVLFQLDVIANTEQDCKDFLSEKTRLGLETKQYSCDLPYLIGGIPNYFIANRNFKEIQKELWMVEESLKNEIKVTKLEIESLQVRLNLLEISLEENIDPPKNQNLKDSLILHRDYLELLKIQEQQGLEKLELLFEVFSRGVEINQNKYKIEEFVNFKNSIQVLDSKLRVEKYKELKQKNQSFRKTISDQISIGKNPDGSKKFDGTGYKALLEALIIPESLGSIQETIKITENPEADKIIIQIAEKRGYQKQSILKKSEVENLDNQKLVPHVGEAYLEMKGKANTEGIEMGLTSSYRSVDEQRELFLTRLKNYFEVETSEDYSDEKIATGNYNSILDILMQVTAPPGYSRHHSGYTIDISGSTPIFANSPGFDWISKDNYANSREFGFIPSYPPNTPNQGPNPEEWEYIWVGKDVLF